MSGICIFKNLQDLHSYKALYKFSSPTKNQYFSHVGQAQEKNILNP